jgi:hypothetical protein
MKHSEMVSLASLMFFAHILPKGISFSIAFALSFLGIYLSAHGN